jgi:hypothetical protein
MSLKPSSSRFFGLSFKPSFLFSPLFFSPSSHLACLACLAPCRAPNCRRGSLLASFLFSWLRGFVFFPPSCHSLQTSRQLLGCRLRRLYDCFLLFFRFLCCSFFEVQNLRLSFLSSSSAPSFRIVTGWSPGGHRASFLPSPSLSPPSAIQSFYGGFIFSVLGFLELKGTWLDALLPMMPSVGVFRLFSLRPPICWIVRADLLFRFVSFWSRYWSNV